MTIGFRRLSTKTKAIVGLTAAGKTGLGGSAELSIDFKCVATPPSAFRPITVTLTAAGTVGLKAGANTIIKAKLLPQYAGTPAGATSVKLTFIPGDTQNIVIWTYPGQFKTVTVDRYTRLPGVRGGHFSTSSTGTFLGYPTGIVTPYGAYMMLEGVEPLMTYISFDGSKRFYIRGGLAPIPGVQDGVILQSISGMSPPFKHIDQQGARQDGTTWNDTVYEPMEIDMTLVATAYTPQRFSYVVRDWIGAWDPKKPGRLEYFTPEMGTWSCDVRLMKTWPDQMKKSSRRHRVQTFTHAARNDNSFWRGVDSVSSLKGRNEVQTITLSGSPSFKLTYKSKTNVSLTTGTLTSAAFGLVVQTALESLTNIGVGNVVVTGGVGGPFNVTFQGTLASANQNTLTASSVTGGTVSIATLITGGTTANGHLTLTNTGSEDAWPRYLCTGPGTFTFGNGPSPAPSSIVFGPLTSGQKVLITTMPRLRSVVDLSPSASATGSPLSTVQTFVANLVKLVTLGQVPPLLQWFESLFGIQAPQGALYSLLKGRFSEPIPGVGQPTEATTTSIACTITGGDSKSNVVAALTPLRRWPE